MSPSASPAVSIIVPCYNSERWLKQCLDSILSQTWRDLELIIVDDGSVDQTAIIAQTYADERVHLLRQTNQGACAARNAGFAVSRGRFVNFFDSDDIMHPRKIESQITAALDNPTKVVTGDWAPFRLAPGDMTMERPAVFQSLSPKEYFELYLTDQGDIPLSAWLVPRALAHNIGGWNTGLTRDQDGEYAARLMASSSGTTHVDQLVYYYRKPRAGSVSQVDSSSKVHSSIIALDAVAQHAEECGVDLAATHIADHYQAILAGGYPHSRAHEQLLRGRIDRYGGAKRRPVLGGRVINGLSRVVGWKAARRLQRALRPVER